MAEIATPTRHSAFLVQLRAELSEPLTLSYTPFGPRGILDMKGGSFLGPRLVGEVLIESGDWVLRQPDGVASLDIWLMLRSGDGSLFYARCEGIFKAPPDTTRFCQAGDGKHA
jgi:hypothetical protein